MHRYGDELTPERRRVVIAKRIGLGIVFAIAAGAVFGYSVMLLWNALLPDIFGVRTISFWQAAGLLILCRLLVGGLHHGGHSRRHHRRWHRRGRKPPVDPALDKFVERGKPTSDE